jgi:drug/metabolite transporter (DMT)-like permease
MSPGVAAVLALSSLLAGLGQVLLKLGAQGRTEAWDFINLEVAFGLAAYLAGLLLWLYGLSRAPLSLVYPFAILTFVVVGVASVAFLGERPTFVTLAGWAVIVAGVAVVYLGSAGA